MIPEDIASTACNFNVNLLDVYRRIQGIVLDELPARLDHIAHQLGEKIVRVVRMIHLHLKQSARIFVQGGFP